MGNERVDIREVGHVAFRFGQVDAQCSVAVGCNGATGQGTKNPRVVGLLNVTLFSPVPVRGGGEEKKEDLKRSESLGVIKAKEALPTYHHPLFWD